MELQRKLRVDDIWIEAEKYGVHTSAGQLEKLGSAMQPSDAEVLLQCWRETDTLFQGLPDWSVRPIEVRHPFCFYYGHLTAFMKLKMYPDEPASEFDTMFSRGIDPSVLDPTKCHSHPETPAEWPRHEEIVKYVMAVRRKVLATVSSGTMPRQAWMVKFVTEHDRMHQETLVYMMTQERKAKFTLKMADSLRSDVPALVSTQNQAPTTMSILQFLSKSKLITIDPGTVVLGEDKTDSSLWDNEYPKFHTRVLKSFQVSARPISIGEFYRFVLEGGYDNQNLWEPSDFDYMREKGYNFPATWSEFEGEIYVHELEVTNHWLKVAHKPVFVSLSEAQAFCRWVGARIMTEAEYQRILDVDSDEKVVEQMRSGGWEWTSTPFQPFPGFEAMPEYPEYSTDFFDGQHFVLKGSSPATHPSMLRDTFRNFYQQQYPFVFAKFRCCRNVLEHI